MVGVSLQVGNGASDGTRTVLHEVSVIQEINLLVNSPTIGTYQVSNHQGMFQSSQYQGECMHRYHAPLRISVDH